MEAPSKQMRQMEDLYESWWTTWKEERMMDYVPQPRTWNNTTYQPKKGDIVVFPRENPHAVIGEMPWRVGEIISTEPGPDGIIRRINIEYKNSVEEAFRQT